MDDEVCVLLIFSRSFADAPLTEEPDSETIEVIKDPFVSYIRSVRVLVVIKETESQPIRTFPELIDGKATDLNCHPGFESVGRPNTRFSVDSAIVVV